jgi:hypothetical protein
MIKSLVLPLLFILQINVFPKINYNSINISSDSLIIKTDSVSTVRKMADSLMNKAHDTTTVRDSLGLLNRAGNVAKGDTVSPIYQSPVSNTGIILSNKEIQTNDFRYTPDFLKLFEFGYLAETGNVGFPDNLYLYGLGSNQTNYMKDGIPLNSNPYINYNLNYLQSQSIDSIEVIPSPRGFLYGSYNRSASVNFISKDFLSINPYTRIKYYQGAFGEAMLDAIFNSVLYKKLFGYLDITNRKLDKRYLNSDFSDWQVTSKLRYLISNNYNITGSYSFNHTHKGLNGGVNVDALTSQGLNVNTYLYDEIRAPVVDTTTYMEVKQHRFNIRLLAKPFVNASTDLNVYYSFDEHYFNFINDIDGQDGTIKVKQYGVSFNQKYKEDNYNLNIIANYEHADNVSSFFAATEGVGNTSFFRTDNLFSIDIFSFAGIAGLNIADNIKASVFYKYSATHNEIPNNFYSHGMGVDVNIEASNNLFFYLGYSLLKDYNNDKCFGNAEGSAICKLDNLYMKLSLFARNRATNVYDLNNSYYPNYLFSNSMSFTQNPEVTGIGVKLRYDFWIMAFENNTSYYTGNYLSVNGSGLFRTKGLIDIPELYTKSGIYISDSLFSSNLNLKGGFVFNYYSKMNHLTTQGTILETSSAYTIDFTLAGRIRNAATIYFTLENLLDQKYYLIPFYPALGRNVRFGIAWDLFN